MEVDEIERSNGSLAFVGPLVHDSLLLTDLRAGMNVRAELANLVAWRWEGDTRVNARHGD